MNMDNFTLREAKSALHDILEAFQHPDNMMRMDEARDNAGNDMMKLMQTAFPIATQIQMDVIQKYGFPADGEGIVRFAQTVKMYEKQDPEVAQLNSELRAIVMPPIGAPLPQTTDSGS